MTNYENRTITICVAIIAICAIVGFWIQKGCDQNTVEMSLLIIGGLAGYHVVKGAKLPPQDGNGTISGNNSGAQAGGSNVGS